MSEINDENLKQELRAYIQLAAQEYIKCLEGSSASARMEDDTSKGTNPTKSNTSRSSKNTSGTGNDGVKSEVKSETTIESTEETKEKTPDITPVESSYIKIMGFSKREGIDYSTESAAISETLSIKSHNKVWNHYAGVTDFDVISAGILDLIKDAIFANKDQPINLVNDEANMGTFILSATASNDKKYAGIYTVTVINHKDNEEFLKIKCKLSTRKSNRIATGMTQVGTSGAGDTEGTMKFEFDAKRDKLYSYVSVESKIVKE